MEKMALQRALEILGVSAGASKQQLKSAYRKLSKTRHPDAPGGDEAQQAELNHAYEIAVAAIASRRALVPQALQEPLQRLSTAMASERAMRQADQLTRGAKARSLKNVTDLKWLALIMAALAGIFGWFAAPDVLPGEEVLHDNAWIFSTSKILALLFGAMAGVLQFATNARSHAIDEFTADLDDKQHCAAELACALRYRNRRTITSDDIEVSADVISLGGLRNFLIGYFPRRRILLLKSVGHGLLEEMESAEIGPDRDIQYRVKFQPLRFGSPTVNSSSSVSSKPMSAAGAGGAALLSGALIAGMGWFARLLFSWGYNGWGWLIACLCAFFAIGLFGLVAELFSALKRTRW